jgi:hypothetical protein
MRPFVVDVPVAGACRVARVAMDDPRVALRGQRCLVAGRRFTAGDVITVYQATTAPPAAIPISIGAIIATIPQFKFIQIQFQFNFTA